MSQHNSFSVTFGMILSLGLIPTSSVFRQGQGIDQTSLPFIVEGQTRVTPKTMTIDGERDLPIMLSEPEIDPNDPTQETYLYTVHYQDLDSGEWHNLCTPDADGRTKAIPLMGEWDETGAYIANDEITFACTSGVLAKCVLWGYRPWQTYQDVSLRDYHQACVRMARADYCGDGVSHTQDGTLINIYDRLNIQAAEDYPGLAFEAAWGPDGAMAIARTRYAESWEPIQQACPKRFQVVEGMPPSLESLEQQVPTALIFNDSLEQ